MTPLILLAPVLLAPALVAALPVQGGGDPPQRPKYAFLRWMEDWSVLANGPFADHEPFDALKYVELSDDVWVSFGGHLRARTEWFNNFGFGAPADDTDVFGLVRGTFHSDVHLGDDVRVYAEIKSALATNRELPGGKRPLDEDKLDLQQLFVDLHLADGIVLRPGRQELLFGKQRLVSPLPWGNSLRTWDGVSAHLATDDWKTTVFATRFVPVLPDEINEPSSDMAFHGLYATTSGLAGGLGLDLYWLYSDNDGVAFNGTAGDEQRHTLGARAFAKHGDLDWDVELAAQRGEVGDGDVEASMLATQVGLNVGGPRVFVGLDYASGDKEAGGDVETFNQLYPLGHAYFGQMDVIGRQNVLDLSAGVGGSPCEGWTAGLEAHLFRVVDTDDAIYNPGGGAVRPGGSYDSKDVGIEVDLKAAKTVSKHLVLSFGVSRFFAGDAISDSGPDDDVNFGFVAAQYTF